MTTTKMRRGRRSLAAILAAMLVASVLAVVAGSPVQAANTSFEVKIDTDGDTVPDAREFAGYEFQTSQVKFLPMARDLVETVAGTGGGTEVTGPPLIPAFPAVAAVATGYAADANTGADNSGAQDKVDENFNGASQARISVTSSVKTP